MSCPFTSIALIRTARICFQDLFSRQCSVPSCWVLTAVPETDRKIGYNFRSLQHISPFLEPTVAGISSLWARSKALKYNCAVTVGYPEKVDITAKWPADPEYYNSAITVNSEGETVANYRKTHLYYTDERWALEGPSGFFGGYLSGVGHVAMGICKCSVKSLKNPFAD